MLYCTLCALTTVSNARRSLGYTTCLPCGEKRARAQTHCIVPLHKSNYIVITQKSDLLGINNKGGLVK